MDENTQEKCEAQEQEPFSKPYKVLVVLTGLSEIIVNALEIFNNYFNG